MYINIIINVIDMKMFLLKILFAIMGFYMLYTLFFYFRQRSLVYPVSIIGKRLQIIDTSIEKNFITVGENSSETWFLPSLRQTTDKAPVLLIAHGNATLIDFWYSILEEPRKMGFSALLIEYPGYGDSPGSPSQKSITDIFIKAYQALLERNDIDKDKIVFLGRSLGGGVVCSLADFYEPAAVILLSTFTSVKSFAGKYFLPEFLVKDPYDNTKFLKAYKGPLMLIHGQNDQVISFDHFKKLLQIRPDAFPVVYNSDHNNTPPHWEDFWKKFNEFVVLNGILTKENQ